MKEDPVPAHTAVWYFLSDTLYFNSFNVTLVVLLPFEAYAMFF